MRSNKRLLVLLIFESLLLIGDAGGGRKPASSSLRPKPRTSGTSFGRDNSGRVSPSGSSFRKPQAWGAPIPNVTPVRPASPIGGPPAWPKPQTPGTSSWARPQTPGTSSWARPQTPGTSSWARPQTPGASSWARPQTPGTSSWARPQTPGASSVSRPQTPGTSPWSWPQTPGASTISRPQTPGASTVSRPQTPGAGAWPRLQTPVSFPSSGSAYQSFPSPANGFPALAAPRQSFGDALAQQNERLIRTPSGSSISSTGSGTNYLPNGGRPSVTSLGSFSSGYGSSGSINSHFGPNSPSVTGRESIEQPAVCVDQLDSLRKVIAPAESCFDYFTLAVLWPPGRAYQYMMNGYHVREDKISPRWLIHGLWPSMLNQGYDPPNTCKRQDLFFTEYRYSSHLKRAMENNWYTILAKGWSTSRAFWEHQFQKHGSCATRSSVIGDDVMYFTRTVQLFEQIQLAATLSAGGYKSGHIIKLKTIYEILEMKFNAKVKINLVQNQRTRESYLTEVFICFDTKLNIRDCPHSQPPSYLLNTDIVYLESLPAVL